MLTFLKRSYKFVQNWKLFQLSILLLLAALQLCQPRSVVSKPFLHCLMFIFSLIPLISEQIFAPLLLPSTCPLGTLFHLGAHYCTKLSYQITFNSLQSIPITPIPLFISLNPYIICSLPPTLWFFCHFPMLRNNLLLPVNLLAHVWGMKTNWASSPKCTIITYGIMKEIRRAQRGFEIGLAGKIKEHQKRFYVCYEKKGNKRDG